MGVAVKVTLVPVHITPLGLAEMVTLTGILGKTVLVIEFDVAGEPVAHDKLLVIIHVTASPDARVVVIYVEFVAPEIFVPLSCH